VGGQNREAEVASVTLNSVGRVVADTTILDDVTLHVSDGELLVVVGPSGSGKTSLIRAIAGLDSLTSGTVQFDGEDVTETEVARRDIGMVFQANALFPTHTARGNVGFPLRVRSMRRDLIKTRVTAEARALNIEHILERWPRQLSAGYQQLVQVARAMVRVPRVLLLDEPMAHVDPPTKRRLRTEIRTLQRGYGVTTIYATNDPEEAVVMADRIAALDHGSLEQLGEPQELYQAPANAHIAFLTGPISFLNASVESLAGGFWLTGLGFRIRAWAPELHSYVGSRVRVGVRPEHVVTGGSRGVEATVMSKSFESGTPVTRVRVGEDVLAMAEVDRPAGTKISIDLERCLVFNQADALVAVVG